MFGPKEEEVTRHRREVHNEELHDLYSLPNIIWVIKSRRISWMGHVGEKPNCMRSLVGKAEGRSLGRHRCRWQYSIK
jgi:hypothetical protein